AKKIGIRTATPWNNLNQAEKNWVLYGTPEWKGGASAWKHQWYGVQRFFDWLETKSYKMHVRVLLSKYRSYTPCPACHGSRLKPDANLWRLGNTRQDHPLTGNYKRFKPVGASWSEAQLNQLGGLAIHDLMQLPIERVHALFGQLELGED